MTSAVAIQIGQIIRALRREHGLTQAAFAAAITAASHGQVALERSSVARWESGEFLPALRYRPFIAEVLCTDTRLLFPQFPDVPREVAA